MGKKDKNGLVKSALNKRELTEMTLDYLRAHSGQAFTIKRLFSALKLSSHPLRMLCVDALNELLEAGHIARTREGDIVFNGASQTAEGVFARTSGGRNFVDTDNGVGIAINEGDTLHALPGDRVRVSVLAKRRGDAKMRGAVVEIIQRSQQPLVGTLQVQHGVAFLCTPGGRLQTDVVVTADKMKGAKNGDKVVVRVTDWPAHARNPYGEVLEVLGREGDNNTEMHAILAEFGLPHDYPRRVEEAANRIDPGITEAEVARREDFRDVFTVTIDPRDAKDFDDAISIRKLRDGVWEVGVHIADVSHYVAEGGAIDEEAFKRATSIYLVDRTIPMLPERLCNRLCSLRPGEEKLTFSVIFEMNDEAEVLSHRIRHTIIKSARRYTYEEVQYLLEQNGEARECQLISEGKAVPTQPVPAQEVLPDAELDRFRETLQPIDPARVPVTPLPAERRKGLPSDSAGQPILRMAHNAQRVDGLITLNRMAHKLRDNRFRDGAINFDREEPRFEIDDKGKPVRVYFKSAKDANKLVEEFMLLANRTVAESVGASTRAGRQAPKTLPYRIHEQPDPIRLENLAHIAARFGYHIVTKGKNADVSRSLNRLLADVRGKAMQNLIELASLRAMQKAVYSTYNIGHYGLGFDYYTHFTSPIRRYPDLMVHRLITRYAEGGESVSQNKYENFCQHCSSMEQLAASAERASIKYKQVEFMADKIGEEFDAHISGVTEFGIYAEVDENHCEGLVSVRLLGNEAFDFDDKNYCLVGRQTRRRFSLGDPLRVKVASANLFRKQLDYELADPLDPSGEAVEAFYQPFVAPERKHRPAGKKRPAHGGQNRKKYGKGNRRH